MKSQIRTWMLVAALVLAPGAAKAQCGGGMMGGGHDHGGNDGAVKAEKSQEKHQKKTREAVRKALADETGRAVLMEEVVADREFISALMARFAQVPELRALALESLGAEGRVVMPPPGEKSEVARPAPRPATEAVVYACPMHPEVTADKPGSCPKCGMTLERVKPKSSS